MDKDKNIIVVFRDMVADSCSAPCVFDNDACAIRYFNNHITVNREDYQLKKIGLYNFNTGEITLIDPVILNKGE